MQNELQFPFRWGGWREGAGRKKRREGMGHGKRSRVSRHDPMLITCRFLITQKGGRGLGCLRQRLEATVIMEAIRAAKRKEFRPVHFSIQGDHIHFIIEADSREDLVKGMRGLGCRIARGLNKLWKRKGSVFPERFHERILKSLTQVRNALRYVLNNHRKHHGYRSQPTRPDPFSTGLYFNGWSDFSQVNDPNEAGSYVSPPGWKIARGWQKYNPKFSLAAVPG